MINLKQLIGMKEEMAIRLIVNLGGVYRIVKRDGFALDVSMDMDPNRVNLEIRNGLVSKAKLY